MKALSIRQPWAWLILQGHKPVENRTWPTALRGRIAIHAGQAVDRYADDWIAYRFPAITVPRLASLPRGALVGSVELYGCVREGEALPDPRAEPWFTGPWGFLLRDPILTPPIPYTGRLGFFEVVAPAALAAMAFPQEVRT